MSFENFLFPAFFVFRVDFFFHLTASTKDANHQVNPNPRFLATTGGKAAKAWSLAGF